VHLYEKTGGSRGGQGRASRGAADGTGAQEQRSPASQCRHLWYLQRWIEPTFSCGSKHQRWSQPPTSSTATGLEEVSDSLLGHFVDRSRRSGHSWTQISAALGVTKQAAHKRFSFAAATIESGSPTFERFTPRAKAALGAAAAQARLHGRTHVASEDILLALFKPAEAIAAQILHAAGITRETYARHVGAEQVTSTEAEDTEDRPFTEQTKNVLKSAVEEALRLRHNYIGTEHLLLGLYHDPEDQPAKALTELGLDYDNAKDRLTKKFAELTKDPTV
jgi:ATP-dependent Clp protease ATP-binding subunit ClpA